jgi:DNA-nicking Smr family endonuclease
MSRRPRGLTPDERDLWQRVARTTHAMHPDHPRKTAPAPKPTLPEVAHPRPSLPAFRIGQATRKPAGHDLAPAIDDALASQPLRMDHGAFRNMTRGKLQPEGRIDLHGLTLAEAHPELVHFILNAQAAGRRLVLVITGKGKHKEDHGPIPVRIGALRHEVPRWLNQPPLRGAVLQIATAHLKHGGAGAYYVYLRRLR